MKAEGYGGSVSARFDDSVIDGVRSEDERPAGVRRRDCASDFCDRSFLSRQDGDRYCCEQCDIDMHPEYDTRPIHIPDPGWQ